MNKLTNFISSKKIIFTLLIIAAAIKSNSKKEQLQKDEINYIEEIYMQKKDKKLFKNPENKLDIELNFHNMNLCKIKLIKKLEELKDKNKINFLHQYDSYNFLKNVKNSKNIKSKIKGVKKECKKIEYFMRNIINSLETEIYKLEKTDNFTEIKNKLDKNFLEKINANEIINFIKEIENAKKNSIFSLEEIADFNLLINEEDKKIFYNYTFNEYDEISLRLISHLAIFKNFGFKNFFFSIEFHNFLLEMC